jgi:hypothetical protein
MTRTNTNKSFAQLNYICVNKWLHSILYIVLIIDSYWQTKLYAIEKKQHKFSPFNHGQIL